MTAFVVAAEPIHENAANYFIAELGFYRLGYFVERYQLADLHTAEIEAETPVFGGIESVQKVLPSYIGSPYCPGELQPFMSRKVEWRSINEVREGQFFKPFEEEHKLFSPRIKDNTFECDLLISRIEPEKEVIVTEAITLESEFRVYVCQGEILNICFYKGNPLKQPKLDTITKMVELVTHYSSAFGLDVGVTDTGETVLVEMNDFCCLGNYDLRAIAYARCIAIRWEEAWHQFHKNP